MKSHTIIASLKHLLEENREGYHDEIGVGKDFLTQLTIKRKNTLINRGILRLKHIHQTIPFKEERQA